MQTTLNIDFERLGIRMLRNIRHQTSRLTRTKEGVASARLIASFMFYGLRIDTSLGSELSIVGRLRGVQVNDLMPAGQKYGTVVRVGDTNPSLGAESSRAQSERSPETDPKCLSFSIRRSQRAGTPSHSQQAGVPPSCEAHDIHLSVFVPSIHYTHSVNFVYEMEIFASQFKHYLGVLGDGFKSAAVGVARGFVRERSTLAEGLGRLSTSLGSAPTRTRFSANGRPESDSDEPDFAVPIAAADDRTHLSVLIQTPIIVVPRSLASDECLVAHLGEITVRNRFVCRDHDSSAVDRSPSPIEGAAPTAIDRMVVEIKNVSLHASHDSPSREWLLTKQGESTACPSGKCFRVLRETNLVFQIDRYLDGCRSLIDGSAASAGSDAASEDSLAPGPDLAISGRVCNELLVELPKQVFDQVKTTLQHGLRKPVPAYAKQVGVAPKAATPLNRAGLGESETGAASPHRTVKFDLGADNGDGGEMEDSLPHIFASFSLPKLSLELQHVSIGEAGGKLVYVSFEDFLLEARHARPHLTALSASLRSIVVEDLIQPEESEFRYILASSTKPLPFISPIPSPSRGLHRLVPSHAGLHSSFSRHRLLSGLMSTPKPKPAEEAPYYSPLRAFSPYQERSSVGSVPADSGAGWGPDGREEEGSTLVEESSSLSEEGDLMTVTGKWVGRDHPQFATEYGSVSLSSPPHSCSPGHSVRLSVCV